MVPWPALRHASSSLAIHSIKAEEKNLNAIFSRLKIQFSTFAFLLLPSPPPSSSCHVLKVHAVHSEIYQFRKQAEPN
jgi:hypothetical protein